MAITRDAVTTDTSSTSGTDRVQTFSHTVGAGSGRALLVFVGGSTFNISATYNGVAMTLLHTQDTAQGTSVNVLGLMTPATGANDVEVTYTTFGSHAANFWAVSYFGVDSFGNDGGGTSGNTDTTNHSITLTTGTANSTVVGATNTDRSDPTYTVTSPAIEVAENTISTGGSAGASGVLAELIDVGAAGSKTLTVTSTVSRKYSYAVAELVEAADSTPFRGLILDSPPVVV